MTRNKSDFEFENEPSLSVIRAWHYHWHTDPETRSKAIPNRHTLENEFQHAPMADLNDELCDIQNYQWIDGSLRQYEWIESELWKYRDYFTQLLPGTLEVPKLKPILLIDLIYRDAEESINLSTELRDKWNKLITTTYDLIEWAKVDSKKKHDIAIKLLISEKVIWGRTPPDNSATPEEAIAIHFDAVLINRGESEFERLFKLLKQRYSKSTHTEKKKSEGKKQVNFYLSERLIKKLDKVAAAKHTTKPILVSYLLDEGLKSDKTIPDLLSYHDND